jgi:hypothetical protein
MITPTHTGILGSNIVTGDDYLGRSAWPSLVEGKRALRRQRDCDTFRGVPKRRIARVIGNRNAPDGVIRLGSASPNRLKAGNLTCVRLVPTGVGDPIALYGERVANTISSEFGAWALAKTQGASPLHEVKP